VAYNCGAFLLLVYKDFLWCAIFLVALVESLASIPFGSTLLNWHSIMIDKYGYRGILIFTIRFCPVFEGGSPGR